MAESSSQSIRYPRAKIAGFKIVTYPPLGSQLRWLYGGSTPEFFLEKRMAIQRLGGSYGARGFIFPIYSYIYIYSIFNGELRSYLEFSNHPIDDKH